MNLPEPLTPADLDLRDFRWMPLDVVALRDSDMADEVSGDGFRAAVLLWAASWHQVPAASLPDSDRKLARLAAMTPEAWESVKAEALRGFVRCSDGRLYHPVVASKALEAASMQKGSAHRMRRTRLRAEMGRPDLSAAECDRILTQRDAQRDAQHRRHGDGHGDARSDAGRDAKGDAADDGESASKSCAFVAHNVTRDLTGPDLTGPDKTITPLPPAQRDAARLAGLVVEVSGVDTSKDVTGKWFGSGPANEVAMWLAFSGGALTEADILAEVRAKPKPDIASLGYYRPQMRRLAEAKAAGVAPTAPAAGSSRDRSRWPLTHLEHDDPWTQADSDEHMRRHGRVPTRCPPPEPPRTPAQMARLNDLYAGAPPDHRKSVGLPPIYAPMTAEEFAHAAE